MEVFISIKDLQGKRLMHTFSKYVMSGKITKLLRNIPTLCNTSYRLPYRPHPSRTVILQGVKWKKKLRFTISKAQHKAKTAQNTLLIILT